MCARVKAEKSVETDEEDEEERRVDVVDGIKEAGAVGVEIVEMKASSNEVLRSVTGISIKMVEKVNL